MAEDKIVLPHKLTLSERKKLTLTGATQIVSFDDTAVVLHTTLGTLHIHGQQLELKTLSEDSGQVEVVGNVDALIYEQLRQAGGFWRRLRG